MTTEITDEELLTRLRAQPEQCPHCRSDEPFNGGKYEREGTRLYHHQSCAECDQYWVLAYELDNYIG